VTSYFVPVAATVLFSSVFFANGVAWGDHEDTEVRSRHAGTKALHFKEALDIYNPIYFGTVQKYDSRNAYNAVDF